MNSDLSPSPVHVLCIIIGYCPEWYRFRGNFPNFRGNISKPVTAPNNQLQSSKGTQSQCGLTAEHWASMLSMLTILVSGCNRPSSKGFGASTDGNHSEISSSSEHRCKVGGSLFSPLPVSSFCMSFPSSQAITAVSYDTGIDI